MFCPKCGKQISEKAAFCPKCGSAINPLRRQSQSPVGGGFVPPAANRGYNTQAKQAAGASQNQQLGPRTTALCREAAQEGYLAGVMMAQTEAETNSANNKGGKGKVVAIILSAVAAIIVLVAALAVFGFFSPQEKVIISGSTDAVAVSAGTHIIPRNSQGKALESYAIKVSGANDATNQQLRKLQGKSDTSTSTVNISMKATGTDGFVMGDVSINSNALPDGTYSVVFTDSSGTSYSFVANYVRTSDCDSEVYYVQPSE